MQSEISRSSVEVFVAGVGVGVLGAYLLYKTVTATRESSLLPWSADTTTSEDLEKEVAFHFADRELYIPFQNYPKYTKILHDFTGDEGDSKCIDVGCSIGATTMELSRIFTHVLGVDASKKCIAMAETLKEKRSMEYTCVVEGEIKEKQTVTLDPLYELEDVRFMVADPCALPSQLMAVDCVMAALSLCRMRNPVKFLESLPRLVKKDGTVILVSPYDWQYRGSRLGGYVREGKEVLSKVSLKGEMEKLGFELVHEEDIPFLKRETARKYCWQIADATVWKVRTDAPQEPVEVISSTDM